jgi:hypothetical protein
VRLQFKKTTTVAKFLDVINRLALAKAGYFYWVLPSALKSNTVRIRGTDVTFTKADMDKPISEFIS